jgi:hypothetical protein
MKSFKVAFEYDDRSKGTTGTSLKVDASSLAGAVAKATREFMKSLDRKQRFDVGKSGLSVKVTTLEAAGSEEEKIPTDELADRNLGHE